MTESTTERKRGRSPRYPALDLEVALSKAQSLFRREGRHAVPFEVAARHWGFSPKSSSVLTASAALRAYGLLDDGRSGGQGGKVQLSDLGLKLAADDRAINPARPQLLRQAALNPPIHSELWTKYQGDLPSNDLLEYYLQTERGFTVDGVKTFVRNFRATLQFAGLADGDNMATDVETSEAAEEPSPATGQKNAGAMTDTRSSSKIVSPPGSVSPDAAIRVPVARGEWVTITGDFPMPKAKWDKFLEMLTAMEFALVNDDAAEPGGDES
jgi:hypothetical protein